jgi:predicted Zn-dependent protease
VELQPADGLLVYEQALAQVQLRDRDNARASLKRAAELSPDVPEIQRDLARIYKLAGDATGAALARAREARLLNDAPAAVRLLEPLYARQPETRIGLALAEAYYEADRTPQALSLLYQLQSKEPENPAIPEHLFRAERVVNHNLQALKALDRLAELSPEAEWIPADRADLLQRLNRIPEAEKALEEAVRREPENALRHYQIGALLVAKSQRPDRLAAAEAAFRKALALQPDHLSSRYRLGLLLESSGRFREAIPELRRALDQSPELVDALRVLGRAYASAGEREKSEDTFRLYRRLKAREAEQKRLELPISLNRGTEEDRLRVARFYLRTGQQSAAIKELETVLRRRPGDAAVRQELIGVYGVTRRFQRQWELREVAAGRAA